MKMAPDADEFKEELQRLAHVTRIRNVAIDCAVVNVNVIVIRSIHQRIATLEHTWAARERLQN